MWARVALTLGILWRLLLGAAVGYVIALAHAMSDAPG